MVKYIHKVNFYIFRFIEPIFPYIRDGLLFLKVIHHHGRQRYFIGNLNIKKTAEEFKNHLHQLGFHKNKIAWKDEGEVLGMRKLDGLKFCYHIRLFIDGEIRGHYERTVETNPWHHFFEKGMEAKTPEFKNFIAGFLQPVAELEKSSAISMR